MPNKIETLGSHKNYNINIDWHEFLNGITLKEKLWNAHNTLDKSVTILAHVIFWGRFVLNILLSKDLFVLRISSFADILLLMSISWLSVKILTKYIHTEISKTQNILINKYIYPALQKILIDSFDSVKGNDIQILTNHLILDKDVVALMRVNSLTNHDVFLRITHFIDTYRVRNWLTILLYESCKIAINQQHQHLSELTILEAIFSNFSDKT